MNVKQRFIHNLISSFAFLLAAFATYLKVMDLVKGNWVVLGTMLFYAIVATLFLIRKPSQEHSTRFMHWIVAMGASWLPFVLITEKVHIPLLLWASIPIQAVGTILVLVSISILGRGFGVIAARRDIRTSGPYGYVRHPLYAAEAISFVAVLMQNPSLWNVLVFLTVMACQVSRMSEEEAILSGDPAYVEYRQRVRYRLIPGIY